MNSVHHGTETLFKKFTIRFDLVYKLCSSYGGTFHCVEQFEYATLQLLDLLDSTRGTIDIKSLRSKFKTLCIQLNLDSLAWDDTLQTSQLEKELESKSHPSASVCYYVGLP
uniref:Uncharacterized protein n=1 Tax=Amphimedon queenslandica TaxID=400682 RepID=A0A1X7UDC2_AMPQE